MTFLQTLAHKIYQDFKAEQQQPSTTSPAWNDPEAQRFTHLKMITNTPILTKLSQHQAQKSYPKTVPQPYSLTSIERQAWQWLNEQGAGLNNPFTLKQLKKVKFKLAKKMHPDQGGDPRSFMLLLSYIYQLSQHPRVQIVSSENNNR